MYYRCTAVNDTMGEVGTILLNGALLQVYSQDNFVDKSLLYAAREVAWDNLVQLLTSQLYIDTVAKEDFGTILAALTTSIQTCTCWKQPVTIKSRLLWKAIVVIFSLCIHGAC